MIKFEHLFLKRVESSKPYRKGVKNTCIPQNGKRDSVEVTKNYCSLRKY